MPVLQSAAMQPGEMTSHATIGAQPTSYARRSQQSEFAKEMKYWFSLYKTTALKAALRMSKDAGQDLEKMLFKSLWLNRV